MYSISHTCILEIKSFPNSELMGKKEPVYEIQQARWEISWGLAYKLEIFHIYAKGWALVISLLKSSLNNGTDFVPYLLAFPYGFSSNVPTFTNNIFCIFAWSSCSDNIAYKEEKDRQPLLEAEWCFLLKCKQGGHVSGQYAVSKNRVLQQSRKGVVLLVSHMDGTAHLLFHVAPDTWRNSGRHRIVQHKNIQNRWNKTWRLTWRWKLSHIAGTQHIFVLYSVLLSEGLQLDLK